MIPGLCGMEIAITLAVFTKQDVTTPMQAA